MNIKNTHSINYTKYPFSQFFLLNIGTEEGGKAPKGLDSEEEQIKRRIRRFLGYSIR